MGAWAHISPLLPSPLPASQPLKNTHKTIYAFQNLTQIIYIVLQHMLAKPKPKNIMIHYFHSSILKTINFCYILIYIS